MAKQAKKKAKSKKKAAPKTGDPSPAAMARAWVIVRRALEAPEAKAEDPLSKFGFPGPSRSALAQRLNALGVPIEDGPVVACAKVGCVVTAVARVNG
jgi:hypothetical protein